MTTRLKSESKAVIPQEPAREPAPEFSREQIELLKHTYAKDATDDEFKLFLRVCRHTGLDPFNRQIYLIPRWDTRQRRTIMTPQTSIDGFRVIASRTGMYEGQVGPFWCGPDGEWKDVWTSDEAPNSARVGVFRTGFREALFSIAKFSEYAQTDKDGELVSMWRKMPANQLAKCAEALSLRKAFPQELSGLYTSDEMGQAERDGGPPNPTHSGTVIDTPQAPPQQSTVRPWSNFKEMINAFAKLHGRLPEKQEYIYGNTLAKFGVQHSNQFKDSGTALACYYDLKKKVEDIEVALEMKEKLVPTAPAPDAPEPVPDAVPETEAQ